MQFLVLQNYTGTYSYFQHLIFTQGRRARAAAGERKKNQNCQQLLKGAKKCIAIHLKIAIMFTLLIYLYIGIFIYSTFVFIINTIICIGPIN